jgi:hypothetical protein
MPTKAKRTWTIEEVLDKSIQLVGEGVEWFEGKAPDEPLKTGYKTGPIEAEDYMLAGQLLSVYVGNAVKLAKEVREARDPESKGNRERVDNLAKAIAAEFRAHPELKGEVDKELRTAATTH